MRLSALGLLLLAVAFVSGTAIRRPPAASGVDTEKVRYDDFVVYKLLIKNKTQLAVLKALADKNQYDLWKDYDAISREAHLMVSPDEAKNFMNLMSIYGFGVDVMVPNVQALIDEEEVPRSPDIDFGWNRYYDLREIEAWLDDVLRTNPRVTTGFEIGKSTEGRTIRGIKISYKSGNPGIFIESNIHAREWITSATATWFINQLLTSTNPKVRDLAENYDWYIIPVFNVDGFVYSREKNRMWRKTRQAVPTSSCIGTDPNRNFDSQWMVNNGASSDPCSESYAGPRPFSEPEAKALANYIQSIKSKLKIFIAFHSYGQYLLSPYGHTAQEFPPNYNDMQEISKEFVKAIGGLSYKTQYTYGSTASALYVASGTSVDWVYNTQGIKISYTIEFRDQGRYGFVLPPAQILPNCEELMAGMLALVGKAKDLGYVNRN